MATTTRRARKTVTTVSAVTCDCCGRTLDLDIQNWMRFRHTCGYLSNHDKTTIEAEICDDCVHDLVTRQVPGARVTPG